MSGQFQNFTFRRTGAIVDHCFKRSCDLSKTINFFGAFIKIYFQSSFEWFIGFTAYGARYLNLSSNMTDLVLIRSSFEWVKWRCAIFFLVLCKLCSKSTFSNFWNLRCTLANFWILWIFWKFLVECSTGKSLPAGQAVVSKMPGKSNELNYYWLHKSQIWNLGTQILRQKCSLYYSSYICVDL